MASLKQKRAQIEKSVKDYLGKRNLGAVKGYLAIVDAAFAMLAKNEFLANEFQVLREGVASEQSAIRDCAQGYLRLLASHFAEVRDFLAVLMCSEKPELREMALRATYGWGLPEEFALQMIRAGLQDKVPLIRSWAARVAASLKCKAALPEVIVAEAAEKKERPKESLKQAIVEIRDGFAVHPQPDGRVNVVVYGPSSWSHSKTMDASEFKKLNLPKWAAEKRAENIDYWEAMARGEDYVVPEQRKAKELLDRWQAEYSINAKTHQIEFVNLQWIEPAESLDAHLKPLAALTSVEILNAHGAQITPAFLKTIAGWPKLKSIGLANAPRFTSTALRPLQQLKNLTWLLIVDSPLDAKCLREIAKIPSLEKLHIAATGTTSEMLEELVAAPKLTELLAGDNPIDDAGLEPISRMKKMRWIELYRTKITGVGLGHVTRLKELTNLSLDQCPVDDQGLGHLPLHPALYSLNLSRTKVTDRGVVALPDFPNMQWLHFVECPLTDASVPKLGTYKKLLHLSVYKTQITPTGVAKLRKLLKDRYKDIVNDGGPEGNEPWKEPDYLWKHPPACLKRFKLTERRNPELSEWAVQFGLACKCGHDTGVIQGYPWGDYRPELASLKLFVGPLSFVCGKCGKSTVIIDTRKEGYCGRTGDYRYQVGKGKKTDVPCGKCGQTQLQPEASVVWVDSCFDIWDEDNPVKVENYFESFVLRGMCSCGVMTDVARFED